MTIRLRPAALSDMQRLLEWRNDPTTRSNSLDPDPVLPDTHRRWLERTLADPTARLWIAEVEGAPVGQVRVNLAEGVARISISVSLETRGRGVGSAMLAALQSVVEREFGKVDLVALVKAGNEPSARLFAGRGFELVGPRGGLREYRWSGRSGLDPGPEAAPADLDDAESGLT
jgi:RimJ/RimL family protein N-acetyltransferase